MVSQFLLGSIRGKAKLRTMKYHPGAETLVVAHVSVGRDTFGSYVLN